MSVVIVGAGHAASQVVSSLRMEGYDGAITMIGDEPYIPYQRPPLSKQMLAGDMALDDVYIKAPEFYDIAKTDLKLGTRVDSITRADRTVTLSDGSAVPYEHLVLATGARARALAVPGAELGGIFHLRTIDDTHMIRQRFVAGARLVIIGGGYVGLEVAAAAAKAGLSVTVLEMADRVLGRVVAPVVSHFYANLHAEHGVDIQTQASVSGFEGDEDGHVTRVLCGDGTAYKADFVVVGVGGLPNTELAEAAGLRVENGILVDAYARTSDPAIFAAGDCTNHPNEIYQTNIRLESVQNAADQATAAAQAICGKPAPYCAVPWFWSDQYDVKLQIMGLSVGYDQAVQRGDPATGAFSVFYLKEGVLQAVDAVNSPRDFTQAKKLIAARAQPDPKRIADTSIAVKSIC